MVYLLHKTSFTSLGEVKNYKGMQSFKCFMSGWVMNVMWKKYHKLKLGFDSRSSERQLCCQHCSIEVLGVCSCQQNGLSCTLHLHGWFS